MCNAPTGGRKIEVFGQSHLEETAKAYDLPVLGRLPLDPQVAALCDEGSIELFDGDWLNSAYDLLEDSEIKHRNTKKTPKR